jgi:hypothetical protein
MIKFPNMIKLLVVLAMVCSLVAIAAAPASAALGIALSTNTGAVGTSVTITATDFAPNTILTTKFDGAVVTTAPTTVTADAGGDATFAMAIPAATAGAHTISVTDGVNTASATFTVLQKVAITSPATKQGPVGTSVTVAGTGFSGAGVTADVTIGGLPLASGVAVDSNGSFTATGTVPSLTSGDKTVSASDGAGNIADVTDTFKVTPTLSVSPNSGLPGVEVALSGSGWPASSTVTITFAGGSAQNFTSTSTGALSATYQIPVAATAGVKTIVGTSGTFTASTTFTVVARTLTLTPNSGPRGTTVLITGSNMTPGGTIAAGDLQFKGNAWNTAVINIDSAGTLFPTTLAVPANSTDAPVGANTVQATDSGGLIAYGTFTVTRPTISVSPETGPRNSSLTITGAGWLAGATVTLTFNYTNTLGAAASTSITTIPDGNGNIAAAMNVPADAKAGEHSIAATDIKGNSAAGAAFTVPGAIITVTPAEGPVGTSVTVTGSGFYAYTAITVKIANYQFLQQPLTNALGAFTYTFTVPGLAPGSTAVQATDATNTASAFFVIKEAAATVQTILAGISGKLVRVWGYSDGTWYMYDPADAAGSNLTTLTAGKGYWINVSEAVTLIYGGYSYALSAGWNLIGWR